MIDFSPEFVSSRQLLHLLPAEKHMKSFSKISQWICLYWPMIKETFAFGEVL